MTRIGTKWITVLIVLVLTAGAWAERERERDRKRPERRPEGRSMADRHRGDRERQEREKHNRERQRAEQEHRQRQQREREGSERDRHRRGKPDVRIFRFEHMPAESFMQVLAQLSQKGPLREILSQIPTALHQHSNAVVIIAPPEAMELFERLANELDQPSAFHERMARSRKPGGPSCRGNCSQNNCPTPGRCSGCRGNCRRTNRPSPGKSPGCSGECGGANRPSPRKEPAEINAEAIKRAIGDPVGQLLRKVLSSGELRLDKQQRGAIHKIAQQCGQKVGHMHQRVIQAIRGMGRDERASNARKTVSHARAAMGNMAGEVRKHIFKILKPSQHKTAARILGAPGPAGNKGAKPSKCCGKCPKSKTRAKGGCGGCGSKNKAGAKGGCGGCRGKGKPTPTAAPRGCGSSPRPTAVPGKPRPQAAPSGCGGCGTRGIVLGDTGNCKTSDF